MAQTPAATSSWRVKFLATTAIGAAILLLLFSHNPGASNSVHYIDSYPLPDGGIRPEPRIQGTPGGVHYQSQSPVVPVSEVHPVARKPSFRATTKFAEQQLIVEQLLAQEGSLVQAGQPILLVKVGDHTEIIKAASTGMLQYLTTVSPGGTVVAKDGALFSLGHPQALPMSPVFSVLQIFGFMLLLGGLGTWFWASKVRSLSVAENDADAVAESGARARKGSGFVWAAPLKESSAAAQASSSVQPLATVHEDSVPLLNSSFPPLELAETQHDMEMLKREATEASTEAPLTSRTWERQQTEADVA
eukprot:TRINITY_DN5129_c0_g1_i1.p1 TRINITY_DN5129_c0_g1~~TRINITY_DN5129_c0_g1_i1.p1  ORF type:complete len:320 (-),score=51.15 TRINITY_DN5129_c0_g1_i1:555-1466(-)